MQKKIFCFFLFFEKNAGIKIPAGGAD